MPGTIRRRGKNSWEVAVSAGFDPVTGKRVRIWRTVRGTRKDAERELARLLREVETGVALDPGRATVGEWLQAWLSQKRPQLASKTFERYEQVVRLHLLPALGRVPLRKLHPQHVRALHAQLLEAGLHPRTVLHVHRVLHTALEDALRQEVVGRNVCDAVRPPRVPVREVTVPTEEQLVKLLRAVRGTRLEVPVVLAALCGLRRGEVLGLRWEDVDFDRGVLMVRRSLEVTRAGLQLKETKTGRARAVALPAQVLRLLRAHRRRQAEGRLRAGPSWTDHGLVCPGRDGGPWHPTSFSHEFAALAHSVGLRLRFHDLRHAHASYLLRTGADVRTVAARLGHSTPTLTLNTYGHLVPGAQEEAVRRLEQRLDPLLPDPEE
jgi:integrase